MTDLSKKSVAELRERMEFKYERPCRVEAFDELARRLEEAQGAIKEVSEEDKELLGVCDALLATPWFKDGNNWINKIAAALKRRITGEGR